MKSAVLALLMLVSPSFAVAEPMRNANTYPVNMRGGPGVGFAVLDQLDPGEVAERGRCDLRGLWCLMSTDRKVGWINTSILRRHSGRHRRLSCPSLTRQRPPIR